MQREKMIYLAAANGQKPDTIPIVIEIQMAVCPGFKKLVEKYGFEGICRNAELSAQCTVMPVNDLGVDAAIHMSDLLIPVEAMGLKVKHTIAGPKIENPVRTMGDVEKLVIPDPHEGMNIWLEALRMAKHELTGKVPLIGWTGAPLSTAAFLIEGGLPTGPTPYHNMKTIMYTEPATLHALLSKLTDVYIQFTRAQVDAGADVIMIFDLNAPAAMSLHDYREFSLPYLRELVHAIKTKGVPIVFASDGTVFLSSPIADLGIDVVGLDWTVDLSEAIKRLGRKQVVQGNLEPYCLFASEQVIEKRVRDIIEAGRGARSHIFSLGGWVLMNTSFEKVRFLVDLVHSL
ncbi:MAG: uroporphyrinogen decarboxylase [Proteobacteria bacterium]|nr:uroporphyrinogen decarboxylase [Pseudomonadota bacterium]